MQRMLAAMLILVAVAGCGGRTPTGLPAAPAEVPAQAPAPAPTSSPDPTNSPGPTAGGTPATVYTPPPAPPPAPIPDHHPLGRWRDQVVSLDRYDDRFVLLVGDRERTTFMTNSKTADYWADLKGDQLILVVTPVANAENGRIFRVSLPDGPVTDVAAIHGPPFRLSLGVSPSGRYLAWRWVAYGQAVQLVDLQTGNTTEPVHEAHVGFAHWAPDRDELAVRAAEPGAPLPKPIGAAYADGATHVDLIKPDGAVRHLQPPQPLALTGGPLWSPDGAQLAVTAGIVKGIGEGEGGGSEFTPKEIWVIDATSGMWSRLRDLKEGEELAYPFSGASTP